ncbi:MAG: type I restriction enzyme HsdR N-terminal domain-containing protein [Erysipelotrichaceae bacterium]
MSYFRKGVEKYLCELKNNPAIISFDFSKDEITYGRRKDTRKITKLPGDEEYVRAYIVSKLVNELGYNINDIAFEKEYNIGHPKKVGARIDIIVYHPNSKNIFMFIELKSPDRYNLEKEEAIKDQLYPLAAQEINAENNKIDYLVYYSLNDLDLTDMVTLIDYNKYDNYNNWNNSPNYYTEIPHAYGDVPNKSNKRYFGINDVDSRIERVISSINQHLNYIEVKDSLLFINTCILSLFNDSFREDISRGIHDNDSTEIIIKTMEEVILKEGGEIEKYKFASDSNKKSIVALIKSTCISMRSKKELNSNTYSLLNCLKDIAKKIFPVILEGSNEDKLYVSETIYKYIYIYKSGKNSIISTPANITNFMVKLLELGEEDYFIEFCSGFGNFSLSYLLYMINNYETTNGEKVSGIESEDYIYLFYITTLRIIGLNLIQALNGDMLKLNNIKDLIPTYNENYKIGACMNPPFGGKDNKLAAELVLKGCDILPKGSLFAVILPYVFAIGSASKDGFSAPSFHKNLLNNNTLLASFSLADGTFGAAASTVVTTLLIKTGIPHFKKENNETVKDKKGNPIPNEKTYLMFCKDDGYKILKNTRVEKKKGLGKEKINFWLENYKKKIVDPVKSAYINIGEEDEWLIEAYMKTDYTDLVQEDFYKTVKSFLAYKIENK